MPSDALTIALTTGLGVSVIAGILSGICYILTQGVPRKRTRRPRTPWHCNVCQKQFRSIQGVLEVEKVVTCAKCKEKVCRAGCSHRDPRRGWICELCQQPDTWFNGLLKAIHPNNTKGWYNSKMNPDTIDELDEDLLELRKKEREQVRDFIERLVESMLGGNLDDVSVGKIYNDKKYDVLIARYHADLSNALTDLGSALHISISNLPITGQSPCTAHASLKLLIQRFIREAVDLPELKKRVDHPAVPEEQQNDRTYEDLLSTAIINKVVQSYQNETPRSSTNSISSRASGSTKKADNKEYFFSEETLEAKWRNNNGAQDDTSSASSMDEWAKSDSSLGSSKYVDHVSLTIKQRIEEGSSSDEESGKIQVAQETPLLKPQEVWNENWFLQKRLAGTNSPVPVPMLVPNPTVEAKVLIGDREAEDTSDLSDAGSDFGDAEVVPDIKNILVNSRTIIGGKNVLENVVAVDEDVVEAVGVNSSEEVVEAKKDSEALAKPQVLERTLEESALVVSANILAADVPLKEMDLKTVEAKAEDASLLSLDSNTEQDTEYTEQYGSLPRTVLKSPKPTPRTSKLPDIFKQETTIKGDVQQDKVPERNFVLDDNFSISSEDSEEKWKIFKGSYSERDKEKWKHAVEMPNNPYTTENLERRLSSRSSEESLFGRDYYIKEAARSTGARKKADVPYDFEASNDYSSTNGKADDESDQSAAVLVTAIPAYVQPEDQPDDSLTEISRPNTLEISSDSDLSIERIYNLESGRVIQNVGHTSREIAINSRSPEGIKYTPRDFEQEFHRRKNVDENHNHTNNVEAKKREFLRSLTEDETSTISDTSYGDVFSPASEDHNRTLIDDIEKISRREIILLPPPVRYASIEPEEVEGEVPHSATLKEETIQRLYEVHSADEFAALKEEAVHKFGQVPRDQSDDESVALKEETLHKFYYPRNHQNNDALGIYEETADPKLFGDMKKLVDNKDVITVKTSDYSEEETPSERREFSLEYSTDFGDNDVVSSSDSLLETDSEIIDLKEKRLVKDVLGKISKSFPNLSATPAKNLDEQVKTFESIQREETKMSASSELDVKLPSVRNLKKLFDKENNLKPPKKDQKQVHSITARSISREVRQELRSQEEKSVNNQIEVLETLVNGNTEEAGGEELPFDIAKNRIAFFERLKGAK